MRSPEPMPSNRLPLGKAVCLLALLLVGSGTVGCGFLKYYTPACRKMKGTPATLQVEWAAPEGVVRSTWRHKHNGIAVAVLDPVGLSLGIGSLWDVWCRLASEPELDRWIANAEVLRSESRGYRTLPESHRELLVVSFRADAQIEDYGALVGRPRYAEVADLSPAALEAARNLSCMARARFGAIAENSIVELTPTLAARVGFPATCSSRNRALREPYAAPTQGEAGSAGSARRTGTTRRTSPPVDRGSPVSRRAGG